MWQFKRTVTVNISIQVLIETHKKLVQGVSGLKVQLCELSGRQTHFHWHLSVSDVFSIVYVGNIGSFVTYITFFLQQVRFYFVILLGNDNVCSWTVNTLTSMWRICYKTLTKWQNGMLIKCLQCDVCDECWESFSYGKLCLARNPYQRKRKYLLKYTDLMNLTF